MPTPVESAQLILKLFELRRDPVLREARAWFLGEFFPQTFEEFSTQVYGPRNASFRMVVGYWDMAASLVSYGAIDADMFRAGNGEIFATFARVEPFLAQMRRVSGYPDFLNHLETVVSAWPGAAERLERMQKQFRVMAAAKAKDQAAKSRKARKRR